MSKQKRQTIRIDGETYDLIPDGVATGREVEILERLVEIGDMAAPLTADLQKEIKRLEAELEQITEDRTGLN